MLLGGGRALLMQLAHPAVATGVAEHSSFRTDRLARLLSTLRPTRAIVYGTREQALEAVASIRGRHATVTGEGYSADDPDLLFWVLATLIDTTLLMHERFLRPLSPCLAEAYYRDMLAIGELLGVSSPHAPPDLQSFRRYMSETERGLTVSPVARRLAGELFGGGGATGLVMRPLRQLKAALLPPALREQYGLDWGTKRETGFEAFTRASRLLLPLAPASLRRPPALLLPPRVP